MTVNEEADALVYGPREEDYSHPIIDFTTTGRLWGAILGIDDIDAEHVALMMAALKLSRLTRNPAHRDSMVDVCGYMAAYERVRLYREEEEEGDALYRGLSGQTVGTPTEPFKHAPCLSCQTEGYETAGQDPALD